MLKLRVVSAIIMAAVFLSVLFLLPALAFSLFIAVVVVVGAWEWANLSGFEVPAARIGYAGILGLSLLGLYFYCGFDAGLLRLESIQILLLIACGFWTIALLWVQGFPQSSLLWGNRWLRLIMGLLVLLPTWLALVYVRSLESGQWLVLLAIMSIACADIGGYFVGRRFGRRKLAIHVSPRKTWEGFWGGQLCNAVLALVIVACNNDSSLVIVSIVIMASLASVLGDLFVSMVKRHRGIKDSSQLLPGHGGVLDRVDGITAAMPFYALGLLLTGWHF
jgi:phosphatidate cytidylyltransferase|tara:strand:- start:1261 stop:2091 length:831 start_codon:yes stop_codon:yes gene_type:complete